MPETIELIATVPAVHSGSRLDQVAAKLFPDFSRSRLQQWIKTGELTVDGAVLQSRTAVYFGASLALNATLEPDQRWEGQPIALKILYEDEHLLVLDKAAKLVVHPAAGHGDGTLLNALLFHCPDLALVPRAGIVHRLDKDTTGLMVVAKTLQAHTSLVKQLKARTVSRHYEAVVQGVIIAGGTIDEPIGRHPTQRIKMAVRQHGGKEAVSHYRVLRKFAHFTHLAVQLETGRTHQIRVHMMHLKHPLVGDPVYGGRFKRPARCPGALVQALADFPRQALHARKLSLLHPQTKQEMSWECPLPQDFRDLLQALADAEESFSAR